MIPRQQDGNERYLAYFLPFWGLSDDDEKPRIGTGPRPARSHPTARDWSRNNVNLPIACHHGPNSLQAAWQGGAGLKSMRTTKSKLGFRGNVCME